MTQTGGGRKSRAGAPLPAVPDKLYFRIGEVARLLELPAYVLRFWESEFPQLKPGKGSTGQRLYRRADLDILLDIRHLLYDQGYTIPGARQLLRERMQSPSAQSQPATQPLMPAVAETATTLMRLRSDLREIARILSEPVTGVLSRSPGHRGLHLASKKRVLPEGPPTLFAMRREPEQNDRED